MCKEHLISIIVPVYNVENKIRRCLDCLVNQSYKNIEIILVNDGSTDDSGAICDRYAAGDERVRVIHKKNGGVSSARNRGLDEASGLYIMFVDSDDYIEKNACEVMIDAIEKYGVDLIVASYNTVYNGKVMRHICPEKVYSRVSDIKEDFNSSSKSVPIYLWQNSSCLLYILGNTSNVSSLKTFVREFPISSI